MPQSIRPGRRSSLPTLLLSALLSAVFVFAMTAVSLPGTAFAGEIKLAACSVNLRTSPYTTARIKATLKAGTRVTAVAAVRGSAWKATCNGKTISSRYWYRISGVSGRSVKSLYGVTYVYGALYLFKASPPTPPAAAATPTPTPAGTCGTSLQTLINGTPTGGTLTVPACVYREAVTISRAMTVNGYGSVIDGRDAAGNLVRSTWLYVSANDVTVRGFTMRYAAGTNVTGSVENAVGVQRFTLEDCEAAYSYVNVNLTGAIDSVIRNCSIHDAKHLGVRVSAPSPTSNRGQRNALIGNRIFHNDRVGEPDPGADGGNLKATGQDYLTLDGNDVFDSGVGLWLDVWCRNTVISNNRVYYNDTAGIHDETSTGTRILGNAVWKNGFGPWGTWGWGAGILIHSSKGAEVSGNTLAWNNVGISVIEEDRGDSPGVTGNYVHDNVVVEEQMAAGKDHFGLFWAYSLPAGSIYQPGIYLSASNNRGANNRFWYTAPENSYPRFIWNGYHNLASFVTVPGGTASRWLTDAEKTTALSAVRAPAAPWSRPTYWMSREISDEELS